MNSQNENDFNRLEAATDGSSSGISATTPRQPSGDSTGVPQTPTGGASRGRKRSKREASSADSTFEMEVLAAFKEAKAAARPTYPEMDEYDHFGREVAFTLRRLDAEKKLNLKIGFWRLVQEIEFGEH